VEAGTKSGKTSGAILWLLRQAWERPGTRWWWVAPIYRQTEIAFGRIVRMLLRAGMAIEPNQSAMRVPLPNGSVLEFRSGEKPQTLYGEDVHGAVLDEATQGMREEVLFAVQTTLTATRGRLLVLSTPRGRRNWFWKLCQRAKAGERGYDYVFMRSADNPAVPREKLDDAKRNLPARVYRELFEAEAQDDEASVFRNVRACIDGALDQRFPSVDELARRHYVAGVDLGRHEDFTVVCVMDRMARSVVAFDRFTRIDWHLQKDRIAHVLLRYRAAAYVDATGAQDAVVEDLQRMGAPVAPFVFTAQTKQRLVEFLAVGIEQRQMTFPDIPELVGELESFGYEVTRAGFRYAAPEGLHDDCVMALGLAWQLCGPVGTEAHTPVLLGDRVAQDAPWRW